MNPLENRECMTTLAELFPQSDLSEAELRLFGAELNKFEREDVLDAIREHRLKCRFNRPQFETIFAISREKMRGRPRQKGDGPEYRTPIARSVAASNPVMRGRPEAELILRNARYFLRFKSKDHDSGRVEFYTDAEMPRDRLPRLQAEAVEYLIASGWEKQYAEQAAQWIEAPLHEFDEYVRQIGNTQEVPVFA